MLKGPIGGLYAGIAAALLSVDVFGDITMSLRQPEPKMLGDPDVVAAVTLSNSDRTPLEIEIPP